jgi:hypothetical protein
VNTIETLELAREAPGIAEGYAEEALADGLHREYRTVVGAREVVEDRLRRFRQATAPRTGLFGVRIAPGNVQEDPGEGA